MESRLTDLEIRFTHIDDSVEELTKTTLHHEQKILFLEEEINRLKQLIKGMSENTMDSEVNERPPHY